MLVSLLDEEAEEVMVTFEHWCVPPDSLCESPLHPDLNCFYGVEKLGHNAPGPIYGYCYLEELNRTLEILGKQWVSEKADEPAGFWRQVQPVSSSHEPVLPTQRNVDVQEIPAAGTGGGLGVASSQQSKVKKLPTQDARFLVVTKEEIMQPAEKKFKVTSVKSRVDHLRDPAHGVIREEDLRKIRLIREKNLARYLNTMIAGIAEVPVRVGISKFLTTVKTLADHAYEDARFGRHLITLPLSPKSIFTLGMMYYDLQTMIVWMVPPIRDVQEMSKTKFQEHVAYWRFWNYQGVQSSGFLSDT